LEDIVASFMLLGVMLAQTVGEITDMVKELRLTHKLLLALWLIIVALGSYAVLGGTGLTLFAVLVISATFVVVALVATLLAIGTYPGSLSAQPLR